ncbi:MAG TPA: glycerophosphodiester phosphodiesterase, partial [Planctomycetaceae bacterium]|nr:glycerophosphodiester phosphodiesterase [Planctomycetaceae bacterium]
MTRVLLALVLGLEMGWSLRAEGVEIIGHRGASHDAPENTLASVMLAWQQGADAVEIDVFLSKDGRIIAIHDKTTKRLAGLDRPVADQTFAELRQLDVGLWKGGQFAGERIPTLAEVLATIPDGRRLFIEIKCGPEIVPELKRELDAARKDPRQTAVIGFSLETVAAVKRELPLLACYWVVELKPDETTGRLIPDAGELIGQAREAGLEGLDVGNSPPIDAEFVAAVKAAELELYVWTVNDVEAARRLRDLGIDGLTT